MKQRRLQSRMSLWNFILARRSSSLLSRDWILAIRMLGKGTRCARALSLFLTPAHFPRGLFLASRPLFSFRIPVGHLGSGVGDGVRCRPFHLPREFTSVFIIALYIPPSAHTREALQELYGAISELQNVHPDGLFIVAGYFNHANLKSVLPKFNQRARKANALDLVYTNLSGAYRAEPRPHLGYSDHMSVMLIPAYRPIVRRSKPLLKQVRTWPAGAISALQDCFEQTTWITFKEAATDGGTVNLEEYTTSVTVYISKCIDDVIVSKTITTRPNQKPWMTADVRMLLRTHDSAFRTGDREALRKTRAKLSRSIREAKRAHAQRIHGHFKDTAQNNVAAEKSIPPQNDQVLCLTAADLRRTLRGVNSRKAAGPDNIPGHVLRECADQFADVLTDIFNIFLSCAVVPTCFKTTTVVPVPKKPMVSCLNDCCPVALTSIIMKCFKRLFMRHIKTQLPPSLDPLQFAYRCNCSTDDAISTTLHLALTHLDKKGHLLMHSSNHIIKFADDTTVMGLINKDNESAYREEVQEVESKARSFPACHQRLLSGVIKNIKFLGVHLAENLIWTLNTSSITKRAQQRLYILRKLREAHLPHPSSLPSIEVEHSKVLVKEGGVQLLLTIVDTPGFGDAVDNSNCWQPVTDHIDSKFEDYLNAESRVNRRQMPDNRVHCCLYFIAPSGHGLKPLDIEFMKRLHEKVNIIPLIAKADTLTPEECQHFKKQIMREIQEHKIKIYEFPDTDDEEEKKLVKKIKDRLPLAVVGSNTILEVNGKRVRGRQYPWGMAEVENSEHCDFTMLGNMLIRTHMQDLKDVTNNVHYENYRSRKLAAVTYNGADNNKTKGQLTNRSPLAQMEEERREHVMKMKKMESEMEQVFEMKVKEKLQKLRDSEAELQRRHEQMKKNLEAQHKELEEKRRQFEEEKNSWEAQQRLAEQQKLDTSRTLEKNKKKKIF
ncbi:hypothetical protein P4O66_019188 [Electrophorus voltai]|uniref:Septin-7 n=1 Tax=Electrophorus voltai TaxID=2609070 RepID=A0AAD8ZU62_9TELE|nr:hypothetical protein P4O66_019188 [Electrophorus voltai]